MHFWTELWKAEPHRISFLIEAMYLQDRQTCINEAYQTPSCALYSKQRTLEHIFSCCTGEGAHKERDGTAGIMTRSSLK